MPHYKYKLAVKFLNIISDGFQIAIGLINIICNEKHVQQ